MWHQSWQFPELLSASGRRSFSEYWKNKKSARYLSLKINFHYHSYQIYQDCDALCRMVIKGNNLWIFNCLDRWVSEERSVTCGKVVGEWHMRVVWQRIPMWIQLDCCPRLWDSSPGRCFRRDFSSRSSQAPTPPLPAALGGRCRWSWRGRGRTVDCTLANADPGRTGLTKRKAILCSYTSVDLHISVDLLMVRMYEIFQELTSIDFLLLWGCTGWFI